MAAAAPAIMRTYFQCEACNYGSFEIKEIELHMHETHTDDVNPASEISVTNQSTDEDMTNGLIQSEIDENIDANDDIQARSPSNQIESTVVTSGHCFKTSTGVDSNSDSEPSDVIWSNGAVRLLIALVKQILHKFVNPTTPKHYLWKTISWKMAEKGYNYTHVRCDNKWRSLKKTYRNARQLVRSGKAEAKMWKYYSVMDEFMAEQELEVENGTGTTSIATTNTTSRRIQSSASKKRRKPPTSLDENEDTDVVETNRERRHREKMEQIKRFNDLFEMFVNNNKSLSTSIDNNETT